MGTQGNSGSAWGKAFRALGRAGREGATRLLVRPARRVVPGALLSVVVLTGFFAPLAQAGIGIGAAHAADQTPSQGRPNHFDPRTQAKSIIHLPHRVAPAVPPRPAQPSPIVHGVPLPMRPATVALDPVKGAHFIGSDGVLAITVPAGAVTAADEAAAGGPLGLRVTQIMPASGSNAGGSGLVSFGTYLIQVLGPDGTLVAAGLRKPIAFTLTFGHGATALDLTHAFVVINGGLPYGLTTASGAALPPMPDDVPARSRRPVVAPTLSGTRAITAAGIMLGRYASQPTTLDLSQHQLKVVLSLSTPSTSMSWNTDAPVATYGKPDPFNVDLSAGALSDSLPIDVPAGPGGLTPPVTLSYSSESVAEQHSPQGAAPWVGEGWNMNLGSISWAEHNGTANCPPGSQTCSGAVWQDSWQLSDPFGTSTELIPPSLTVNTYYDDTPNTFCNQPNSGPNSPYGCPIVWQTAPETHIKVVSYIGSVIPFAPSGVNPFPPAPCFRVWLTNGIMEEFGCTVDSLQYYYVPGIGQEIANWNLDLITDPEGNQIHLTYKADSETKTDPNTGKQYTYQRDVVLSTIEWDSIGCHNAQAACTSWTPLMRVSFTSTANPLRGASNSSSCNTGSNLRCDDPKDLSPNGLAAPDVQSVFTLNDILVQVRSSGLGSWNTLRDYQLTYSQTPPTTLNQDPTTGKQESTAGQLLLTQVVEVGDDTTTALPARQFGYTKVTEHYEDDALPPNPVTPPAAPTNCGPSWNTGSSYTNGHCLLWSQSYDGNSWYLSTASNGMGLAQTFTYAEARSNTHGVPSGQDASDPLYCTNHQSGYPCNAADDQAWSHVVLTQESDEVLRAISGGSYPVTSTTVYTYHLTAPLVAQECLDCVAGFYWGNENETDYLDYYNGKFMGFAETDESLPDGSLTVHKYDATEGWGVYDTTQITCQPAMLPKNSSCPNAPWWDLTNAAHGHETEMDQYDTNGTTLLKQVKTQYQVVCVAATEPTQGVGITGYGTWNGHLVSELDKSNPVAACEVRTTQVDTYNWDSASPSTPVPHATTTYAYDSYGRVTSTTTSGNDGGATGSPTSMVHATAYMWNDAVSATSTSATGTYLIDFPSTQTTQDTGNTTHSACNATAYDGVSAIGQTSALTLGETTASVQYTGCGVAPNWTPTGALTSTNPLYDTYGNLQASDDPDANDLPENLNNPKHLGCTLPPSQTTYTSCTGYDTTFKALPVATGNAAGLSTTTTYAFAASDGFGLWPASTTDANLQTTSYGYDALGRMTSETLPGESNGTTVTWSYTDWCSGTGAQLPCVEIDQTQRVSGSATVTTRAFYDGYGQLVETRTPGSSGDVIRFRYYDPSNRDAADSVAYTVTPAYSGPPGSAAFATPDNTQADANYTYDGLGRILHATDTASNTTNTYYAAVQPQGSPVTDTAYYAQVETVDPNGHATATLTDALGRAAYQETFAGNSLYTLYTNVMNTYDLNGNLTKITQPNGTSTTTYSYDAAGRKTGMVDPDRGTESYSYDDNGNLTTSVDARGAAGTVYSGYDGLNRQLWRNTTNSATGAYVTYSYDGTAAPPGTSTANYGLGRLTGETFAGGPSNSLTGSYSFYYDGRGQTYETDQYMGGTRYATQQTFNDAGQPVQTTYPDNATATVDYSAADLPLDLRSSATNYVISNAVFAANGQLSELDYGGTPGAPVFSETFSYDLDQRLSEEKATLAGQPSPFYDLQLGYDAASNVVSTTTTLPAFGSNPAGTDHQSFCYDEFNRLVWAGTSGTPAGPAAGTCGPTPGGTTLTGAGYTATYAYDTLNRLTTGPAGTYTYGDPSHLHAVTSTSDHHGYAYDASGNATCRTASTTTPCSGTPSGAALAYDDEGRLAHWQTSPTSSATTDDLVYDGTGQRVEQQVTTGGSTTTTLYIGALAEYTLTGGTSWQKYYTFAGQLVADYNGHWHDLLHDQLGTAQVQLTSTGAAESGDLRNPYGNTRYGSSAFMGDLGYTGQRKDSTPNLTYFGARYYDQDVGVFISADTYDAGGLNRYAYVGGNPESKTDPTGHRPVYSGPWESYACCSVATLVSGVSAVGALGLQVRAVGVLRGVQHTVVHALNFRANKVYYQMRDAGASPEKLIDFAVENYRAGNVTNAIKAGGKAAREADAAEAIMARGGRLLEAAKWVGYAGLVAGAIADGTMSYDAWLEAHPGDSSGALAFAGEHAAASTVGSIAGAYVGGVAGAALGASIGSVVPVVGTVIGGYVGGFIGSAVGGYVGGAIGDWAVDAFNPGINTPSNPVSAAVSTIGGWFSNL